MKSFLAGLAAVTLIALTIFAIRGQGLIPSLTDPSPTPSSSPASNWDMAPETSPNPTPTPTPSTPVGTKGGVVEGASTAQATTTVSSGATTTTSRSVTTTKVTSITILESDDCRLQATSYVRGVTDPLTIKYALKDGYTAKVAAWKTNGEELIKQTLIEDSGVLKTLDVDGDIKFEVSSEKCEETSDTWLRITAER